jgi:hypothetical protein
VAGSLFLLAVYVTVDALSTLRSSEEPSLNGFFGRWWADPVAALVIAG